MVLLAACTDACTLGRRRLPPVDPFSLASRACHALVTYAPTLTAKYVFPVTILWPYAILGEHRRG